MKTNVVAIRVDASREIGVGHFMRSLELARQFKTKGSEVHFICHQLTSVLHKLAIDQGHHLHTLTTNMSDIINEQGAGAVRKSSVSDLCWRSDAERTSIKVTQIGKVDLLIVDSYKLDARWERELKKHVTTLLVIDDLANRAHEASYLIDHNYGRKVTDYEDLIPADCIVLAGPQYAMLRREFSALRSKTLLRRKDVPQKKHLLVTLGGGGVGEQNIKILDLIRHSDVSSLRKVTLSHPESKQHDISAFAVDFPVKLVVHEYIEDMAGAMSQADLCIGAGGISSMERAVLGLPSLVLLLADNQFESSQQLAQNECLFACSNVADLDIDLLNGFFNLSNMDYKRISNNTANVSDGRGIQRILGEIESG